MLTRKTFIEGAVKVYVTFDAPCRLQMHRYNKSEDCTNKAINGAENKIRDSIQYYFVCSI